MTGGGHAALRVVHVHRPAGRNLLLLTGPRSGRLLTVGDAVVIRTPDGGTHRTHVRTVEPHTRPGTTTVGVPAEIGDVPAGSLLCPL
ncbi:hypothetical protein [Plantactinospora sp. B5E13]|uniref:hypothetical protein n=1 Tax=unclassified Plantactinospora TaxID=2631981 RepID=UPI00325CC9D6